VAACCLVTALLAIGGACSSGGRDPAAAPSSTSAAGGLPTPSVHLTAVGDGFDQPIAIAPAPDGAGLWIAERTGRIWSLPDGGGARVLVLDLSDRVLADGQEQGLLGMAVDPSKTLLVVNFVDRRGENGTTNISRFPIRSTPIDPDSGRVLFSVRQPFSNHNGGQVTFGPDGKLYAGLGDGGGQGDPSGNGQSLSTPLGKILRMEVATGEAPSDNPFVGRAGAEPRIWSYGLRNPWRFSIDPDTGDLWIGDVGGDRREEIDRLTGGGDRKVGGRGANLGWQLREGTLDTDADGDRTALVDPLADFRHEEGWCAIIGGVSVANGASGLPVGTHVFGDQCKDSLWEIPPSGAPAAVDGATISKLTTLGLGTTGALFAASLDGGVYRLDPGS